MISMSPPGRGVVIVTGGAGYIGGQTAKALHQAGFAPICVDNLARGHLRLVKYGTFQRLDITDRSAVREALSAIRPIACIHCAGLAFVQESFSAPAAYYDCNTIGTLNLLDVMHSLDIAPIVLSSSCSVYRSRPTPLDESAPTDPDSPYASSKLAAETIVADYCRSMGLRGMALRYFNVCGADPDGELGECSLASSRLISRALAAAGDGQLAVVVSGSDLDTPDGTPIRDYVHVSDVARANVLAVEYLLKGGDSRVLNIGTGRGHSVAQVLSAVEKITQRKVRTLPGRQNAGDAAQLVASIEAARKVLGFEPQIATIEDMIATAWRWHQSVHGAHARN